MFWHSALVEGQTTTNPICVAALKLASVKMGA
jgi:hypothetical protein